MNKTAMESKPGMPVDCLSCPHSAMWWSLVDNGPSVWVCQHPKGKLYIVNETKAPPSWCPLRSEP